MKWIDKIYQVTTRFNNKFLIGIQRMVEYPVIQVKFNFLGSHVGEKKIIKLQSSWLKKTMSSFTSSGHRVVTLLIERWFFFSFSSEVKTKIAMFNE